MPSICLNEHIVSHIPKQFISCDTLPRAESQETWFWRKQLSSLRHSKSKKGPMHLEFLGVFCLYIFCDRLVDLIWAAIDEYIHGAVSHPTLPGSHSHHPTYPWNTEKEKKLILSHYPFLFCSVCSLLSLNIYFAQDLLNSI